MSRDDFDIELGQSVRRHIAHKESPLNSSGHSAAPYDSPAKDSIPVFITESVMRSIERHVGQEKEKEVGGVLLGGFYRNDKGSFVEVTDFIEAGNAKGTDVSLTFTHETWEKIHEEVARRGSDAQIVGWYHSHPALGVFMSKDDEFIHKSFFSDPWHVAIVVDPIYHNWGCFKWNNGILERTGGMYVFGEKKSAKRIREYVKVISATRQPASRAASAGADRRMMAAAGMNFAVWIMIAVLLIMQVVTGYLALSRRGKTDKVDDYGIAMRMLNRGDLTDALQHLKQAWDVDHSNKQAYTEYCSLKKVLANKNISKLDNEKFDEINDSLYVDYMLATKNKIDKDMLKIYENAESTRQARIDRARKIVDACDPQFAQSKDDTGAIKDMKSKNQKAHWSHQALEWLNEEYYRQIACELTCDPNSKYDAVFEHLSPHEKNIVNRIKARLQ